MARVQAVSGLLFAVFLLFHLATAASASFGNYDAALSATRHVYRPALLVELLLIGGAGSVHIACALIRLYQRRSIGANGNRTILFHRLSGYVLLLFVGGHVFATRIVPALGPDGPADQSYLSFSVVNWPWFIIPYYFLLGAAGATHLGLGIALAKKVLFPALTAKRPVLAGGRILAVVLVLAVSAGVASLIRQSSKTSTARYPAFTALYKKYLPYLPLPDDDVQP